MNSKKLSFTLLSLLSCIAVPTLAGAAPPLLKGSQVPAGKQARSGMRKALSTADELAIRQAVEDYANGFIDEDLQMLLDLWDTSDDFSYIPTESDTPMEDLTTLGDYYDLMFSGISLISGDVSNFRIYPQGTDEAYVYCNYTWVYSYKPVTSSSPVLTQPTRATFFLKKVNGHWLYRHFHESIRFEYVPPTGP